MYRDTHLCAFHTFLLTFRIPTQFLGRVGLVNRVNLDGRAVHILFGDKGAAGMFIAAAVLKQVWRTIGLLQM